MNTIKGFSFYKSYYEALKEIPEKDKKEIIFAMINYVFEDKKPKFKGINKVIWSLIEPNLNTSKNKSNSNSGAPIGNQNARKLGKNEEENNSIKKQSKNNQKTTNDLKDISLSLSLSNIIINNNNNINNIYNLFKEYINLRINNKYNISETIIKRLINKLNEYGQTDEDKIEIISQAINGAWKDFYPLKDKKNIKEETIDDRAKRIFGNN